MDRIDAYKIPVVSKFYFGVEFLFKRIIPKLSLTKKYYFDITKGNDQLLSKAEGLGRLVSCGFKIMDFKSINGLIYFVVRKEKDPSYDKNPSYGPLYAMPRIGKNGKIIKVYKFRTMHPYSEYLQDYVLKVNGYAETGKPADDFRIPSWGKFMRRYWLDEIPQLYNVLKGDLKLVGIRPVSARYFKDIPKEMQRLRLTQKPGCVPPYVSLNRNGNVMSVLQAEKEYLEEKIKNPYFTDTKYLCKAVFNILFRHKRSA
jgi:lipopolysaccharide/colanic/teichoic acid biosynthesis glycosyltransferase